MVCDPLDRKIEGEDKNGDIYDQAIKVADLVTMVKESPSFKAELMNKGLSNQMNELLKEWFDDAMSDL